MSILQDINADARAARASRHLIRLRNPSTGKYLHNSGAGETDGVDWAWSGTRAQAQTLRDKTKAQNEGWPYRAAKF